MVNSVVIMQNVELYLEDFLIYSYSHLYGVNEFKIAHFGKYR